MTAMVNTSTRGNSKDKKKKVVRYPVPYSDIARKHGRYDDYLYILRYNNKLHFRYLSILGKGDLDKGLTEYENKSKEGLEAVTLVYYFLHRPKLMSAFYESTGMERFYVSKPSFILGLTNFASKLSDERLSLHSYRTIWGIVNRFRRWIRETAEDTVIKGKRTLGEIINVSLKEDLIDPYAI